MGRGLIRLMWRQLILGAACAWTFRGAGQVTGGIYQRQIESDFGD